MRENHLNQCASLDGVQLPAVGGTIVNGATQYTQTHIGQIMPEFEGNHAQKHRARWSLLARDDGGSVFAVTPDEGD